MQFEFKEYRYFWLVSTLIDDFYLLKRNFRHICCGTNSITLYYMNIKYRFFCAIISVPSDLPHINCKWNDPSRGNSYVFVQWEEARVLRENLRMHRKNKPQNWKFSTSSSGRIVLVRFGERCQAYKCVSCFTGADYHSSWMPPVLFVVMQRIKPITTDKVIKLLAIDGFRGNM